jgi:hypothetical protein
LIPSYLRDAQTATSGKEMIMVILDGVVGFARAVRW